MIRAKNRPQDQGSSGSIGVATLYELSTRLQRALEDGNERQIPHCIKTLTVYWEACLERSLRAKSDRRTIKGGEESCP